MLKIELNKKFVSANLPYILTKYWQDSFTDKIIIFNLEHLEWIGNTELTFLFSWIRALEDKNIEVSILLQSFDNIHTQSPEYKRRKYCYERIVVQWQLQSNLATSTKMLGGGITTDKLIAYNYANFLPLPIRGFNTATFDQDFENLYNHHFSPFSKSLTQALTKTEISYYDSKFLNYSIIKELYSNVCLHSVESKSGECYFSVGVNRKFQGTSSFISQQRLAELSELELSFFQEGNEYRNFDFVEINFHDFGIGITNSLKEKYESESEQDLMTFLGNHYNNHSKQKKSTRILEYALLLFSSRYEIDRKFEVHDFIPRGLFILKDIVKKYQGYLELTSYDAAIALSFKDGKTQIRYGTNNDNGLLFPGTRVKIILPASQSLKQKAKKSDVNHNPEISKSKFKSISFLKELADAENELKTLQLKEEKENYKVKLTAILFSRFLEQFRKVLRDTVVMIDFSGIEPKSADYFNKFIYFITHFPLYGNNELILYNLLTKGLNSTVIFDTKNTLKSKGFSPHLIPCISADRTVDWLGVNNDEHNILLTQLWIGENNQEFLYENLKNYDNKIVNIENERQDIKLNLPDYFTVLKQIETETQLLIQDELENKGISFYHLSDEEKNYNDVVVSKRDTCFLASNGRYLIKYISFNEKLYIFQYRRMLATFFVFKLHNAIDDDAKVKKINKILSVTLSSQLIGNEVKDILNNLHDLNIDLVALSNYYNFQNEERFGEIKPHNKVIIVNDVISTGALTNRIIKSIEIIQAVPLSCLSIVDSRTNPPFSNDVPVYSLGKLTIEDYDEPPKGYKVEVINPVLNVPTSMPKSNSKENVLMTREEFLEIINEKYLIVGNLKNISVYFNYFLKTHELLLDDSLNGFPVLKKLLVILKAKKQISIIGEMRFLSKGLEIIGKNITENKLSLKIEKIQKEFSLISDKLSPELFDEYAVDVVFYPFLSDMGVVENDSTPFLESSLSKNTPKIFPIPRIMTTRGWRFSFPPKFLNVLFKKNKLSVLIIDDGSLTGETIMQMIDSISFLSVKSIDVFSIFGRLEDFQKELLSRIKSVQVKDAVAPINIYFGTHFNIPVHNNSESPFHIEMREINTLLGKLKDLNIELSEHFSSYLNERKENLNKSFYPSSKEVSYNLINGVSKKDLFIFRDFLGRFGSYKLYAQDLPLDNPNFLIKDDKAILTLLTVLNLEPQLYQTFKRIYSKEKINEITVKIKNIFYDSEELLSEPWMQEFYIKSLFYLSPNQFFKAENLIELLIQLNHYCNSGNSSFTYIEYLLILIKLNIKTIDNSLSIKAFENHIEEFILKLKVRDEEIFKEFRFVFQVYTEIQKVKQLDYNFPINKYYKLSQYYLQVLIHESKHDDRLLTNLFKATNKALSVLRYGLEANYSQDLEVNMEELTQTLSKLKHNYFHKYNEFKYIKDILSDLNKYATNDLDLDVSKILSIVISFENILNNIFQSINLKSLEEINSSLDDYKNNILAINSDFAQFILKSQSYLLDEWKIAESEYLNLKQYERINIDNAENLRLSVNPYALNLALRNLLSNKYGYAKNVKWEIYTQNHDDEYFEIYFKQESPFLFHKGDGTGQHIIKTILNNYGILYKRISDNPYTLRISFQKN
jgi:orotate phosphoribosyltransferase